MKWQNWDNLQDRGWCYRLGHTSAHFMSWQAFGDGPGVLLSACGQVIMHQTHVFEVFLADHTINKCGRCTRSVDNKPELLGPGAVAGFWSCAQGMTSQHHWLVFEHGFKSRCGKKRFSMQVGVVEPEILADQGVDQASDLHHCKKCSNYLGVDMAKNVPGKQVIKDADGDLISIEVVQAQLTAEQLGKVVTGGRILADPVEAWIAIDDELGLIDCSNVGNGAGPFVKGLFKDHLQKRMIVIIDEAKP